MIRTTDYERVVTSAPLDRTASAVTSGDPPDAELTPRQQRENLLPMLTKIEEAIQRAPTRREKKLLGLQKQEITQALAVLNADRKKRPSYASHFVQAAREIPPPAMFQMIGNVAFQRANTEPEGEP